jgi:hypothetical protein
MKSALFNEADYQIMVGLEKLRKFSAARRTQFASEKIERMRENYRVQTFEATNLVKPGKGSYNNLRFAGGRYGLFSY